MYVYGPVHFENGLKKSVICHCIVEKTIKPRVVKINPPYVKDARLINSIPYIVSQMCFPGQKIWISNPDLTTYCITVLLRIAVVIVAVMLVVEEKRRKGKAEGRRRDENKKEERERSETRQEEDERE